MPAEAGIQVRFEFTSTPFGARLLLGEFKNSLIDRSIDRQVFLDQSGADLFIVHLRNVWHSNRQIGD